MSLARRSFTAASLAVVVFASTSPAFAAPIQPGPASSLPAFEGRAATAQPLPFMPTPRNPGLAITPRSNIHNDSWMTDTYRFAGPRGRSPRTNSSNLGAGICGSITFDARGRILTVCPSRTGPKVRLVDAETLLPIAELQLPDRVARPGTLDYQNFTGGGYFFLDQRDRIWVATPTGHVLVIGESADGTSLVQRHDYDLNPALTADERITSALPDWQGRLWFVAKDDGKVGTLDPKTGRIRTIILGEEIENSFAVDRDGVYIVSEEHMYRFARSSAGAPKVAWKLRYRNSDITKPGQVDAGSGTTPTLMSGGYVAITDNADPMNVVVYRRGVRLRAGQRRTVCEVPVFAKGASATENSLIGSGRTLIVENNYGYTDPLVPTGGGPTTPGFARVDVNRSGTGCHRVWTNTTDAAPSVVPKLSARTGLIYTYTRPVDPNGAQPWYWTALDVRTGRRVFRQLAGTGMGFNNNYAGIALARDGTAYLGTFSGIVSLRDGA